MAKSSDPEVALRYIRLHLEEVAEKHVKSITDAVVHELAKEQAQFFAVLSQVIGSTSSSPYWGEDHDTSSLGNLIGGGLPWVPLTPQWRARKRPDAVNQFFRNTGMMQEWVQSADPGDFLGIPQIYRGRTLKNNQDTVWTVRLFPNLDRRSYRNFRGLEAHPLFLEMGIAKRFFARDGRNGKVYVKRPLLQPFMIAWSTRLQNIIQRTVERYGGTREMIKSR